MNVRKLRICIFPITLLIVALLFTAARALYIQQHELSNKLVRLHVIANSDSDYDQEMKLYVRDAVNNYLSELLTDCNNRENAINILSANNDNIRTVAQNAAINYGSDYSVEVKLSDEYYPTRQYDTFSLPAGKYSSLQIKIGNGNGQNWWCVVFPPICTASVTDESFTEMDFSSEEVNLITSDDENIILKFKLFEYLSAINNLFEENFNLR